MADVDFHKESVPILRYRLWQLGLDYKGTKNDLIQRLVTSTTETSKGNLHDENSLLTKSGDRACKGILIHKSIWITQRNNMMELGSTLSGFGKGSLSRSVPVFGTDAPEALRGKAAKQRAKISRKRESMEVSVLALDPEKNQQPTVSSSQGDFLAVDISQLLSSPTDDNLFEEHLQLCLWEAFYASFVTKQLHIFDNTHPNTELTDPDHTYAYFTRLVPLFPYYLSVYCYYKERGWSPHSGLKYGVDFVLYYGLVENHVHSPFCVLVDIHNEDSLEGCLLEKSWISLQNRLRLVKQVAKQLLLVHVQKPKELPKETLFSCWKSCLSLEISEMLVERWTPFNKRRKKDSRN
ncbi:hypothetical protein GpartN1_g1592.t1 [Galdieria partita]|uniref:tRNA-intron lyase n=1 Tax=Galdieria partita TaxID=83374 RepID=A0A9C7PST5_9RHOD|nr:hypothetical protein GpartN1_g1592.t1 [Galdieria partita]